MSSLEGKSAFPFRLPATDGQTYCSDDYLGHWLLLVFHRHLS